MPKGVYKHKPLLVCRKGLHDLTKPGAINRPGTIYARCFKCLQKLRHARRKTKPGYCRANLHLMVGDNIGHKLEQATVYCKACNTASQKGAYHRRVELGYKWHRCPISGCKGRVHRHPNRPGPLPYYCPKHRIRRNVDSLTGETCTCSKPPFLYHDRTCAVSAAYRRLVRAREVARAS